MARILLLIAASDTGDISVDFRGARITKEGMLTLLDEAKKLVEQGNFGTGNRISSTNKDNKHDYKPDYDKTGQPCEVCGFGLHHPWHN